MRQIFIIVIFIFSAINCFGQDLIRITDELQSKKIGKKLHFYLDEDKTLTYEDVISEDFQQKLIPSESDIPYFGYKNSTVWLKFTIKNETSDRKNTFLLIDYPLLYKIRIFIPSKEGIDTLFSGDGYVFDKRESKLSANVFKLSFEPGQTITYYCSIESDGDLITIPISVFDRHYFHEKYTIRSFFLGTYYGFLILIILINLFYYFNIRNKVFLHYILFIFAIGMYLFARDGLAFRFFWPDYPVWANLAISFFGMLSVITVMIMIKNILNTKQYFPVFDKILLYSIIIISLLSLSVFIHPVFYRFMIAFGNILTAYGITLCLIIAIIALKRKIFFTKYFLFALSFLIIGGLWVIMKNSGATGIFEFEHGMKVCTAILILILAYGMTYKYWNILKESQQQSINRLEEINKMKDEANIKLENEVKKRTHELQESYNILQQLNEEIKNQKEEIEVQRDRIEAHRNTVVIHRDEIQKQKDKITSSIKYASRIQRALLVKENEIKGVSENFIFFKPKEIVSGDFYWYNLINEHLIVAVADCTGHGVPGGFMSMLGISFLNEIVNKQQNFKANEILNQLRDNIIISLKTSDSRFEIDTPVEGMSIVIVVINLSNMQMQYSGSYNPLYLIRKNKLEIYKTDRNTIGMFVRQKKDFNNHTIQLQKDDLFYMFSDGYIDQFNEDGTERFKYARFKELLLSMGQKPMAEQKNILDKTLKAWKGNNDQIDDITVLGFKV